MKRFAMMVASGLMLAGSMIGASLPAQAAPTPSVSVTITDLPGTADCSLAFSVRGLEPGAHYVLYINGLSSVTVDYFMTDARGAYKWDGISVNRPGFNKTNTITTTLSEAGQPPIVTRVHVRNRCPAS